MKRQLADTWNTARQWFYRAFLPRKVTGNVTKANSISFGPSTPSGNPFQVTGTLPSHAGVDLAAAGDTDFTVEATYRLDGHKPVELLSMSVLHRDGTKTTFPREGGNETAL